MNTITLTIEDADKICEYFRGELKKENNDYNEAKELIDKNPKNAPLPIVEILKSMLENTHSHNVEIITRNIELLICGSKED